MFSSTQIPHLMRTMVAGILGMPENHLRVIAPEVGGGFGISQSSKRNLPTSG